MQTSLALALLLSLAAAPQALTLQDALKQAQADNRDLRVAQARLAQAHELHKRAWANYLPTLTVGGSYTRNSDAIDLQLPETLLLRDNVPTLVNPNGPAFDPSKGPPSATNPPGTPSSTILYPAQIEDFNLQAKDQLGAQVALSQALIAPALWPAIRNAYFAETVAELTAESARREVLFAVAQVYYGAASLKENVAVLERLLGQAQAHERDAQAQVKAGALPKIVLLRAQIDRARAEEDLLRARNAYASAKIALATLLARAPDFEIVRPDEPAAPAPLQDPEETALRDRPDVRAAAATAELADRQVTATRFKYAPNVGLQAAWRVANIKGFVDSYTTWAVTVGLTWTLWDGGLREVEVRENEARTAEARAQFEGLELKAREEVRRAALDLESARANRAKAEEQLSLARENERLVRSNFQAGVATALEASDAETAQRNAEIGFVAETLNSQLAALRLAKSLGAFEPR